MSDEAYTSYDLKKIGSDWMEKIRASEKREKTFLDAAKEAEEIYLCESDEGLDFNILHSNVETIVPSIFNSSPVPDIRPRHSNPDNLAKLVSDALERVISTQIDDNRLDAEIEAMAQDAFVAGRGIVRIKFDADVQDVPALDPFGQPILDEEGQPIIAGQKVTNETVLFENVSWRDYREGPANRWDGVPWIAYRHEISEEERQRLENPELWEKQRTSRSKKTDEKRDCSVWEIWCKETGRVYFVIEESEKVLDIKEDPLGLTGFFPQPQPVQPIGATGRRCPVVPFKVYEGPAEELDRLTRRINGIIKGMQVKGLFAGDAAAAELLAEAPDNTLVPVENLENLAATGGLEKAIMWWPIQHAAAVLRELYVQREQTKQSIYEITGISDIIRGQGAASETATAQQIKTQWGSLRVKKLQRLIERSVRDLFVLASEIIVTKFTPETIQKAAGMELPPEAMQMFGTALDHYRIDIESDSTVRADLTKSREEMAAFLKGTAEFFATMAPVVQSAPEAAGPLAKMYAAFARQFALGKSAEDALDEFVLMAEQAATQPRPNPEAEQLKAEMQMKGQELQLKMQELQGKMQEGQNKMQIEIAKAQAQLQGLMIQKDIKGADLVLKQMDIAQKGQEMRLIKAQAVVDAQLRERELDIQEKQGASNGE